MCKCVNGVGTGGGRRLEMEREREKNRNFRDIHASRIYLRVLFFSLFFFYFIYISIFGKEEILSQQESERGTSSLSRTITTII